jgi:hypothetical protein
VSPTLLGVSHGSGAGRTERTERPAPVVIAPLWRRIVTGQVVGWRIRLLLGRLLRLRRSAARRSLSWLDRHPEFHDVLAEAGPFAFAKFAGSSARIARSSHTTRPARRTRYRPDIAAPSGLDVDGLRGSVALAGVALTPPTHLRSTCRAEFAEPLIEIRPNERSADPVARMLDAVDLSTWNPTWFRQTPDPTSLRLRELPGGRTRRATRARARTASRATMIVCDEPTNTADGAQQIAQLAVSGLPVVGAITDDVAGLLGPEVTSLITATPPALLADADQRERYSIALRRAALHTFSPRGRWSSIGSACGSPVALTPSVTVLLASNRPDDVLDAARQVAAQRGASVQLVVGLHGSHMSHELDEQLADVFGTNLVVRHLPDELNLGQVLSELTVQAEGDLVTKWDDDDWYDSAHLTDLVAALEYSGADMVAKAAEFVYLESLDLTVRRFATGSERFSTTVAGGTFLLPRAELQQIGWADAPRRVDRLLIDALEARSGTVYRTHGFGYVLRRRSGALGQHTWQAGDAYFLRQSVDQRTGLDLAFAGFTEVSEPIP